MLEIVEHQLSVYVVHLKGRLDVVQAAYLKEELKAMTRESKCNFILDLRDVTFIDSTGLGVFMSLLRAARGCGGDVRFVAEQNSPVHRILTIVRFDQVFEIFDSVVDALRQFHFGG